MNKPPLVSFFIDSAVIDRRYRRKWFLKRVIRFFEKF